MFINFMRIALTIIHIFPPNQQKSSSTGAISWLCFNYQASSSPWKVYYRVKIFYTLICSKYFRILNKPYQIILWPASLWWTLIVLVKLITLFTFFFWKASAFVPREHRAPRLRGQRMSSSRLARVAFRGAFSWKKRTASLVTTQVNTAELRAEEWCCRINSLTVPVGFWGFHFGGRGLTQHWIFCSLIILGFSQG